MKSSLLRTDEEIIQLYEAYADWAYHLYIKSGTEDAVQNTFIKLMHHNRPFASVEQ